MSKPVITVLALGGTIAMTRSEGGGVVPTLTGEALVAAVPGLEDLAQIDARSFRQLPSAHLKFDDLEDLATAIRALAQEGRRGVVVTQGTDTIEETAFVLDRLLEGDMPVVVTGAMRNPTVPGADGPGNLLAAVQVAASDAARGYGCLVVMNDEIHAARFVRKMHTSRLDAFASPACGRVGWVTEGVVRLPVTLPRVAALRAGPVSASPRVALFKMAVGDDAGLVQALADAGIDGLVVEATGGGHVSPWIADVLGELARKVPVILTSRTGTGDALSCTYGFPGSEIDLQRRGLIRGGWLDGLKAKALLTLALRRGIKDSQAVAQVFGPWSI